MQFVERVELSKVTPLTRLTFKDWKGIFDKTGLYENEDERKYAHTTLKKYCESIIRSNGKLHVIYSHSKKDLNREWGRLYADVLGMQMLCNNIRAFLIGDCCTDVDMVNSAPTIIRWLCIQHDFDNYDTLDKFINCRQDFYDELESDGYTKLECKKFLMRILFNDKVNGVLKKFPKMHKLDLEIKGIQKYLFKDFQSQYKEIFESVKDVEDNKAGKFMCRLTNTIENQILQTMIKVISNHSIEICSLVFDGVIIYGNHYNNNKLLEDIMDEVENEFVGMEAKFKYKEFDKTLTPDNIPKSQRDLNTELKLASLEEINEKYYEIEKEFEKTHFKLKYPVQFGWYEQGWEDINWYSKVDFINANSEIICGHDSKGKPVSFVRKWIDSNPNIRQYDMIGNYPVVSKCPSNIFNIWVPFRCEIIMNEPYQHQELGFQYIMYHIKGICGEMADFFNISIAHSIQCPDTHGKLVCLTGPEGAGKTTVYEVLLPNMLGNIKVFQAKSISEVTDKFNAPIEHSYYIILNETDENRISKDQYEILKSLVTDGRMTIERKGKDKYQITSFKRVVIVTNRDKPVYTTQTSRRPVIIKCLGTFLGDTNHFTKLRAYMNNIDVVRTCYSYYKNLPKADEKSFREMQIELSEYHKDLNNENRDPIDFFLETVTLNSKKLAEVKISTKALLDKYVDWATDNHFKDEISKYNTQTFSGAFSRFIIQSIQPKVKNVEIIKHTRMNSNERGFNINVAPLIEYYDKLNCKLDDDTEEPNNQTEPEPTQIKIPIKKLVKVK